MHADSKNEIFSQFTHLKIIILQNNHHLYKVLPIGTLTETFHTLGNKEKKLFAKGLLCAG